MNLKSILKKIQTWNSSASKRERLLVAVVIAFGLFYFLSETAAVVKAAQVDNERKIWSRTEDLKELRFLLTRYKSLKEKRDSLQQEFDESSLSFEQVTSVIDSTVRKTLGSDNYDLKKTATPSEMGLDFEKQAFTLLVKEISITQLVALIHAFEYGKNPLIVGNVDIARLSRKKALRATVQLYSIRRK